MENKLNLTLDDVKDFLYTQGYDWKGGIIYNNQHTYATDIKQLDGQRGDYTILKLQTPEKRVLNPVVVDDTAFTFYVETISSDIDDTFEYESAQDLSEQWVKFLVQRYGNAYRKHVKDLCKQNRKNEIETTKSSLEKIRFIKLDIIRRLKNNLNRYEDVEKWLEDTNELKNDNVNQLKK